MAHGICARSGWIAAILITGTSAFAIDRVRLDRCQAELGVCYDSCKSRGTAPGLCDIQCTTDRCGLPWRESYGAFLDRRIEENAARTPNKFIGLHRLKEK
jgi:hypothetical protein